MLLASDSFPTVNIMKRLNSSMLIVTLLVAAAGPYRIVADEIEIAQLERSDTVDFDREILPILQRSCLACHNESDAESELVLESPESILSGGATGDVVVPGDPDKSFLLQVSAHREEPVMPPEDNSVEAPNLTPNELGLLRLWILQGAKASAVSGTNVEFEPLPPGLNPVYALALSSDSQVLAAGRANQVSVYHLPSQRELARLTDPKLIESGIYSRPGIAHLDLVQSIAISPNGRRIATGGFRTVKLWEQQPNQVVAQATFPQPVTASAGLPHLSAIAVGNSAGQIYLVNTTGGDVIQFWAAHDGPVTAIAALKDGGVLSCGADQFIRHWHFAPDAQLPSLLRGGIIDVGQPITAMCVTGDQSQFLVATADHQLQLWDANSILNPSSDPNRPAPVRSWAAHEQRIGVMRLMGETQSQFVTGADDGKVRVWNYSDGTQVKQFDHGGAVMDVVAIEGGSKLASCGLNQSIKVWDVATGQLLHELKGDAQRERNLAAADLQQRLSQRLLDLAKADLDAGTKRKAAEDENLNKSREAVAAGEQDLETKKTALADAQAAFKAAEENLTQTKTKIADHEQAVASANTTLAEAMPKRDAIDTKRQQLTQELAQSDEPLQQALAELSQARAAVAESPHDLERLQSLQALLSKVAELTGAQVQRVQSHQAAEQEYQSVIALLSDAEAKSKMAAEALAAAQQALPAAEKMVTDTKAAADKASQELEASTRNLESLQRAVVRAEQALQLATDAVPGLEAEVSVAEQALMVAQEAHASATAAMTTVQQPFTGLTYDPSRGYLFSLTADGHLQSWDLTSGAPIETFAETFASAASEPPSPGRMFFYDGNHLAVLGGTKYTLVKLDGSWKLTRQIGSADGESPFADRVTALDFHPDGELLAVGSGEPSRSGQILFVKSQSGEVVREIDDPHSDTVWAIRFSPDGTRIATGGADRFMKVFDVATGELIRGFEGHTHHVLGVAWSADGRQLASAGADKSVKIWDALTGEQQRTIEGFGKEVTAVRFVGLENQVLTSSGDQSVQVKRGDNGGNVRAFGGFDDFVHCVDISADGRTIAAGGQDSVVRIWSHDGKVLAEFRGESTTVTASAE